MVHKDTEAERLKALSQYDILDTEREKPFDELTMLAAQVFNVPIASISIVDSNRQWFKSSIGLPVTQTERSIAFCTHTIEQNSPLIVENATLDERFFENPLVAGDLGIRFYAGIPLITKEGFALGTFCIIDKVPRHLSKSQIALLQSFGNHVMALLELRHETIGLQTALSERETSARMFEEFAERLLDAQRVAKMGSWELSVKENSLSWSDETYRIFDVDKANSNLTFESFSSFIHPDDLGMVLAAQENVLKGVCPLDIEHRIVLRDGSERYVHELAELKRNPDNGILKLCGTVQDITDKKAYETQINRLAFYDNLTGLPNRQLLLDRLSQALALVIRDSKRGALIYLDLDNFKVLNDTLGHDKGDILLNLVAIRLASTLRQVDSLARVGGDEFTVLLSDLSPSSDQAAAQAKMVANSILRTLQEPFQLGRHTYYMTASIGIAMFSERTQDIEDLLKRADLAMFKAKSSGKNAVEFFDPKLQALISSRAAIEYDLRIALHNDEFKLFYQPQVDQNRNIIGCEALIRWLHPKKGLISPADFIPIAEETGLICAIGQWVLDTACKQLSEWKQIGKLNLTLAVNVSAKQFKMVDFVETVLSTIYKYEIDPSRLKLELTESMLVDNLKEITDKMHSLKNAGIGFSLDDFGTGYSSLNYLAKLPLDQLKIDQSFVKDVTVDENSAAIAKTIISLGQSLKLSVIAEGVETLEQQNFLFKNNCNLYQGYLFSKPIPIDEFNKII